MPDPTSFKQPRCCVLPKITTPPILPNVGPPRAELMLKYRKKWVNGTRLHYYFFDDAADGRQHAIVRDAFERWRGVGIGLLFEEVDAAEDAEIRIAFDYSPDADTWSHIGRDAIDLAPDPYEQTMNFSWDLTNDFATALHEVGHVLGFPHEHQNPRSGIIWNERGVYDAFRRHNWSDSDIYWNVLRKLDVGEVGGSQWDPNSIMHYPFEAGLIDWPSAYRYADLIPESGLSPTDIEHAQYFYPFLEGHPSVSLAPLRSHPLTVRSGQQVDLRIHPPESRRYNVGAFGRADRVMVLFEDRGNGTLRYVAGDDDSGFDRDARISAKLYRGQDYVLKIRICYTGRPTAVMLW